MWHVLYTHGGAYVSPLSEPHWEIVGQLIEAGGAAVTVATYPLAPEHTHEAAYQLLERVYRGLLTRVPHERIVLCGDSAGGGLALGQALYYRDRSLPTAGHVVLLAPWLDATL